MKTTFALLAIATSLTFNAHAGELDYPPDHANSHAFSRMEVRAELVRARAAGEINHGEETRFAHTSNPSLSRAAVRAELSQARSGGHIAHGELDESTVRK